MYCFEANKCNNLDCPVRTQRLPRCWLFFAKNSDNNPAFKCKASNCEKCNYKLGWEIGLISDDLFKDRETLPAEDFSPQSLIPEEKDHKSLQEDPGNTIETQSARFCYEIVNCHNEHCPVREQQIFRCFKFFGPRTKNEKEKITCCNRNCSSCFYKSGWDLGLLSEEKFEDIIAKKKSKLGQSNKYNKDVIIDIYMSELAKKPYSHKEELELAKKIAGDKKASELFLLANLKLVTRIAKKFSSKMPLMDLIQEGNIGLIKAIAKFDYRLGYKFSTYAAYWIRYYMQRAVAEQKTSITIPCHLIAVANKIKIQINKFEEQLSRPPTLQELSELLGLAEEKIINILNVTKTPVSIYAKVSNDSEEDETIEYYLEDKQTLTPEEAFMEKQKSEAISAALTSLNERQKYIVENFYGINCEEKNLAEIGREQNVSRERVRQLLQQALQKLKQNESIIEIS